MIDEGQHRPQDYEVKVLKIKKLRNAPVACRIVQEIHGGVGVIGGKWWQAIGFTLTPGEESEVRFEPRPDKGAVKVLDSQTGGVFAEYQIYKVVDLKSAMWALRKFCSG